MVILATKIRKKTAVVGEKKGAERTCCQIISINGKIEYIYGYYVGKKVKNEFNEKKLTQAEIRERV